MIANLVDVYVMGEEAEALLYVLLAQRPAAANISHSHLPSWEEHQRFVRSRPYREWFIVKNEELQSVGAVYATKQNEVGVAILQAYQRRGYAKAAVQALMAQLQPLRPQPSFCNEHWLANVAPGNHASHELFKKLGGSVVQVTYRL